MDCPFRLCTAWLIPVVEQAQPGDDELTIFRMPMHELQGSEFRTTCPASLMAVPLNTDAEELLEEQARGIEHILADRRRGEPVPPASGQRPAEHSRTPHPGPGKDFWFKGHQGTNPRRTFIPGLPVIEPVPLPPQERGSATVGDSHAEMGNALIANAKEAIGAIQTSISALTNEQETITAQISTFQERGEEIAGMIMQAAEGTQVHDQRMDEAVATVMSVTNESASSLAALSQRIQNDLAEAYERLGAAHDQLEEIVF